MSTLPGPFEVTVEDVELESPDTATLALSTAERPCYRAGQYVSISPHQFPQLAALIASLEQLKGKKEPPRKYSLASAPHEPQLMLTVKAEEHLPGVTRYPPLISNLLVRGVTKGAHFTVFGCAGPYVLPDDLAPGTLVVHIVAGTGAVPNFSIVKDALHRELPLRHLWVASNKRRVDVLFHERLLALGRAHEGRLSIVNTLTRENAPGFRSGRISRELLQELIAEDERGRCLVYACGPAVHPWVRKAALETGADPAPRFMETVMGCLNGLGIDPRRVRRETYG